MYYALPFLFARGGTPGMMTVKTYSALIFCLSFLFAAQEASAPVPVENEPLHHVSVEK